LKDKKISPLFVNIYNPSLTISIAQRRYNRKDIILYYENNNVDYVYSCSKPLRYYGIKPGLSINFVRKIVDKFFPLEAKQFTKEKDEIKKIINDKMQEFSFSINELPYFTVNPGNFDSYSLLADFTGCQLLYKPIYNSLDLIFKSIAKEIGTLNFSFFISDSFSFSTFYPSGFIFELDKNLSAYFFNSKQFTDFVKLSTILSPLTFFEESGFFYFSDLEKLPSNFQDKLLDLSIYSSPLSSRIKLSNRLKPLLAYYKSSKSLKALDLFVFKITQRLLNRNQKNKYEIQIIFTLPTNDKNKIFSEIRRKLFLESYFLKNYWLNSRSQTIFTVIEYSNQSIDRFGLHFSEKELLEFFTSIATQITSKLKGKSSVCQITIELDKSTCEELFESNIFIENKKLLSLFDELTRKFGESKIHLAG